MSLLQVWPRRGSRARKLAELYGTIVGRPPGTEDLQTAVHLEQADECITRRVDRTGHYWFRRIPAGEYRVCCVLSVESICSHVLIARIHLSPGAHFASLDLNGASVRGRIANHRPNGQQATRVTLGRGPDEEHYSIVDRYGRFLIPGLGCGCYRLHCHAPGWGDAGLEEVIVGDNGTVNVGSLTIQPRPYLRVGWRGHRHARCGGRFSLWLTAPDGSMTSYACARTADIRLAEPGEYGYRLRRSDRTVQSGVVEWRGEDQELWIDGHK